MTKTTKRTTIKGMFDCNEILYAKTFGPNIQMIKLWCPMNEQREFFLSVLKSYECN